MGVHLISCQCVNVQCVVYGILFFFCGTPIAAIHTYVYRHTLLWYQLEDWWKSCLSFNCNALVFFWAEWYGRNIGRIFLHLQAGTRELCVRHAPASWEAPTTATYVQICLLSIYCCSPVDIHLATKGLQGWPKFYCQVWHEDIHGRHEICEWSMTS